jgi:predicted aldo/keto reductase-like oxidoreductase
LSTQPPPWKYITAGSTRGAPAGFRSEKEAVAFYNECIDRGMTYIDTAPEFAGYGKAQLHLGHVLKERRREVFLVTKCFEPNGEKALQLLKKNLAELKVEQADLVYAHSIGDDKMMPEKIYAADGVCKALEKARRDGLTRFVGVSGHNRPGTGRLNKSPAELKRVVV